MSVRIASGSLIIILGLLVLSCGGNKELPDSDNSKDAISVVELKQILDAGDDIFLVDVRTKPEYDEAHIAETVAQLEYDLLDKNLESLPEDKNTAIYCFCRSGRRSGIATTYLKSIGYPNTYNVTGGIIAWREAEFSLVTSQ